MEDLERTVTRSMDQGLALMLVRQVSRQNERYTDGYHGYEIFVLSADARKLVKT